jgi:predicted SprT family Zn-dependent metalloprotease
MDKDIINLMQFIDENQSENDDVADIVDDIIEEDKESEDEEEINNDNEDDIDDFDEDDSFSSKHKANKKHELIYKTFVKEEKRIDQDDFEFNLILETVESTETNRNSAHYVQSVENDNYIKNKKVSEKIYNYLLENTDMNFLTARRKTSKNNFNNIFFKLIHLLKEENCSKTVIFHELSYYFSDNLRNMFKLLDEQYKIMILKELENYLGKKTRSKEIDKRNIDVDSEIEIQICDLTTDKIVKKTGIVTAIDIIDDEYIYSVDTYDEIYDVKLNDITKIIENIKHKRNFSKIKNIDFI